MDHADAPLSRGAPAIRLGPAAGRSGAAAGRIGSRALRTASWRGRDDVALVVPVPGVASPTSTEVADVACAARHAGVRRLVTGALSASEQEPFWRAGFEVHDRLHLLRHDLVELPTTPASPPLRRARRSDHDPALVVDARAFDPFWRLDRAGLDDAIRATSTARFRVVTDPDVLGYAVTGRAGDRGYVQRLAIDPSRRGQGWGAALVLDGLHWLRRRHVRLAVVNTQVANVDALRLYRRLGFVPQPAGLAVLTITLHDR